MDDPTRALSAHEPHDGDASGLPASDLRAEQARDLPDRDAMSVIGIGGLETGLPVPPIVGEWLEPVPDEPHAGLAELPDGALSDDLPAVVLGADVAVGTPTDVPLPPPVTEASV